MNKAEKTSLISAVATFILSAALIAAAASLRSISMLAGGVITLARALTSLMMFAGIRLSRRRAQDFPTGLYKLENLVAASVGILIMVGAYVLARYAFRAILSGGVLIETGYPAITLTSMLIPMTVGFYMAWYKARAGRKENSPALLADARLSLADAVGLGLIALGVGLEAAGVPDMDEWAALLVAVLVAWVGFKVTLDGVRVLMDASLGRDVLEKVRNAVLEDGRVREVLGVQGRNSGSYRFIDLEVELATYDLREADAITADIKESIRREVENVDRINVDFVVGSGEEMLCAVPLEAEGTAVFGGFEEAPRFCLLEVDASGEVSPELEMMDNPCAGEGEGKGIRLAVVLALRGVEALLLRRSPGPGPAADVLDAYEVRLLVEPELEGVESASAYLASRAAGLLGEGGAL